MLPKRLLVISNGIGEDSIAAEIVRRLPQEIEVNAYPTLGDGAAYRDVCPIVGPRRHLPSEGHRRRGSLWRDARAGFGIGPAMAFMRHSARNYDAVLVVGDMLGVVMCWLSGNRVRIYLDVYKSGYANSYSAIERAVINRSCDLVLTRDALLAAQLKHGRFAGNVMMDTIITGPYDAASRRRNAKAITLLPGSRGETLTNFAWQVGALRRVPGIAKVDLFAAIAPGIDPAQLAFSTGLGFAAGTGAEGDIGTLSSADLTIHLSTGSLGAVLAASDFVMGQAGTANHQALGLGKPIVAFRADGAREVRRRRLIALMGESRIVTERTPEALSAAVTHLLTDDADRLRRGAIGRERIGPPGAIDAIIAELNR